jgi:hypothetical protein
MKALDRTVQDLHQRHWDDELQASRNKIVVLVEGDDDREVLEEVLLHRRPTWSTRVRVVVAGGRTRVLDRGRHTFPDALMLVDRDTWTDAEVAQHTTDRLHVTAGWCLENLFLDPAFLRANYPDVATAIAAARDPWLRAGALWWTLQRAREAQNPWQHALGWTYGVPRDDLDLRSAATVRDTLARKIPEPLRDEARLDIDDLAARFDQRLRSILALPEPEQWQQGVHGKEAFRHLLHPALQTARGKRRWRIELAAQLERPPPLDALVALLLL